MINFNAQNISFSGVQKNIGTKNQLTNNTIANNLSEQNNYLNSAQSIAIKNSALCKISFGSEKSNSQVLQIYDLFSMGNEFEIKPKAGISIETYKGYKEKIDDKEIIKLKDSNGKTVFTAFKKDGTDLDIGIKLSKKIDPTARIADPKTGLTILATNGEVEFKNWGVNLAPENEDKSKQISFGGKLHIFTGFKTDSVKDTVDNYFKSDKEFLLRGQFANQISDNYNLIVTTQGQGTRLTGISSEDNSSGENGVNKAAVKLPAGERTLLHDIIDKGVGAGIIDEENPEYQYLEDTKMKGNAYCIGKSMIEGEISSDKPAIIAPSDHMSNIDFSKVLKDFESKDDCGMMMISVVLTPEEHNKYKTRLVCTDEDMHVTGSVKCNTGTATKEQIENAKLNNGKYEGNFLSSIPIAIFHPRLLEEFKKITSEYIEKDEDCSLGSEVFPVLQKMLENEEIKVDGKPLKLYTTIAETVEGKEAKDIDIGTFKLYTDTAQKIAKGEITGFSDKLTEEYKKNIDEETGAVCINNSKELFNEFKEKHHLKKMSGSVVVTKE